MDGANSPLVGEIKVNGERFKIFKNAEHLVLKANQKGFAFFHDLDPRPKETKKLLSQSKSKKASSS